MTRFAVQVQRDVEYSYDPTQPYYLLTGVTGSVSQAVGGPVERPGAGRAFSASRIRRSTSPVLRRSG